MLYPLNDDPLVSDDPGRDPQEAAFLQSVIENPDDDAPRLIFADWLEEQGLADKAAFVRLEVEFSRLPKSSGRFGELRDELWRLDEVIGGGTGGRWGWAFIRPGRLLNCGEAESKDRTLRFAYECPNRWADLTPLPQTNERFCNECQKNVHFCASKDEAEAHAVQGHCIAIGSLLALAIKKEYGPEPSPAKESPAKAEAAAPDDLSANDSVAVGWVDTLGILDLPRSPYQLWAEELFARHPSAAKRWWQFFLTWPPRTPSERVWAACFFPAPSSRWSASSAPARRTSCVPSPRGWACPTAASSPARRSY
jgi:uncharacterized protein (TIGR02996 family)